MKKQRKTSQYVDFFLFSKRGMNRFMPRYTQKDLINLFLGKIKKKRGRTGSRRDMPVQRGEPVRAALVHIKH